MKQGWSRHWIGSVQPRKQRKYRSAAPLHVRRGFLSAHLSRDLRKETGRRALPLRKGDEVLVMRGTSRGSRGLVASVDLKASRVYVDGIKRKKVDGSEVPIPLVPSGLLIMRLALDDKRRKAVIERKGPATQSGGEKPPHKKPTEKVTRVSRRGTEPAGDAATLASSKEAVPAAHE